MAQQKRGRQSKAPNLNTFYVILAAVALVGVALLAFGVLRSGGEAATEPVALEGVNSPEALVAKARGVARGSADAPIKVLEFGDYQCPACATWAAQIEPRLNVSYVQTGKVQFVFYDFPLSGLHEHAFLAARATRCAEEQNKYWEYHELLYGRQSEWPTKSNAVSTFAGYAGELSLDRGAFEQCLKSDKYADVVTANYQLGERLGVNSTPTVIVNGRRVRNALDYEELKALLDAESGG